MQPLLDAIRGGEEWCSSRRGMMMLMMMMMMLLLMLLLMLRDAASMGEGDDHPGEKRGRS